MENIMRKLYWKYVDIKILINNLITSQTFKLCSNKRKFYLLDKNGCLFVGLQNKAKKYDDMGDLVTSLMISGDSYKYLNNFITYCDIMEIDPVKKLKNYGL